jgi:hypothetical protein
MQRLNQPLMYNLLNLNIRLHNKQLHKHHVAQDVTAVTMEVFKVLRHVVMTADTQYNNLVVG